MYGSRLDCRHDNLDLRHMIWFWLFSMRLTVFTGKGPEGAPGLGSHLHLRVQVLAVLSVKLQMDVVGCARHM